MSTKEVVVEEFDDYLVIKFEKRHEIKLHYFLLRDHCRCSLCYDTDTEQIKFNCVDLKWDIKIKSIIATDRLLILWEDGHKSEYSFDSLISNFLLSNDPPAENKNSIVLWNECIINSITDYYIDFSEYMQGPGGLRKLLQSIIKYGFGFVCGVEPSLEATREVVEKMALVQKTLFGDMWELTSTGHKDFAYSTMELLPHTDNTYFNEPAGLQVFQMISHDGSGGETTLVDGFYCAQKLREKNKWAFDILSSYPITAKYIENGYHFKTTDTTIKLHPTTKEMYHLRYNILDRDVLNTIPFEKVKDFYTAYRLLGKELFDNSSIFKLKLNPGSVLFIDNWRVLHGRTSFTGVRKLVGCYVGRSDWTSKARVMGLNI